MAATEKTNVMRGLDQKKVPYLPHSYESGDAVDGESVARALGADPLRLFKTLVTVGASKKHYVFCIPGPKTLNLKAAAKAVGEKSIAMLRQAELLPLTGYVHGGCSPIGMKKQFPTVIDQSAEAWERIFVSAGKIGFQVEVAPGDLAEIVGADFAQVAE